MYPCSTDSKGRGPRRASRSDRSGTKVYVGNLTSAANSDVLHNLFSQFGRIKHIWAFRVHTGYAFVEYYDEPDAREAVVRLDGVVQYGSKLKVQLARTMTSKLFQLKKVWKSETTSTKVLERHTNSCASNYRRKTSDLNREHSERTTGRHEAFYSRSYTSDSRVEWEDQTAERFNFSSNEGTVVESFNRQQSCSDYIDTERTMASPQAGRHSGKGTDRRTSPADYYSSSSPSKSSSRKRRRDSPCQPTDWDTRDVRRRRNSGNMSDESEYQRYNKFRNSNDYKRYGDIGIRRTRSCRKPQPVNDDNEFIGSSDDFDKARSRYYVDRWDSTYGYNDNRNGVSHGEYGESATPTQSSRKTKRFHGSSASSKEINATDFRIDTDDVFIRHDGSGKRQRQHWSNPASHHSPEAEVGHDKWRAPAMHSLANSPDSRHFAVNYTYHDDSNLEIEKSEGVRQHESVHSTSYDRLPWRREWHYSEYADDEYSL